MNNVLVGAAVDRSRTTLLLMLMVLIAGIVARTLVPIEATPQIDVPVFVVVVLHEGISPEDAERLLAKPLETELRTVEGADEVRSVAYEGTARVIVEFDADYDLEQALADVRAAVDRAKPEFPSSAEEPFIVEQSASDFPIVQINLVGEGVSERVVYNAAQALRDDIEALADVLDAQMQGHREEVLEVVIDPAKLEAYQVSSEQLLATVVRNNQLIAAGALQGGAGRMAVKVPSVIETAQDTFDLPVKATADTVVTLGDLAHIRRTFKDRQRYARVNGADAISINVSKRSDANLVSTVEQVYSVIERHRAKLPSTVRLFVTQDQAPFVRDQVTELEGNIVTALVMVMVLVVAAIGLRSGVIVGMAIPVSFLFALTFVWMLGYTFNFMVMFGMLLGLGMLIDGAIVVTEYADRKMAEGMTPRDAYAASATRMFWPVTASVGTTLAAFLPLVFWPGVAGKFMLYLPVTVFFVLSGSLLYALVFGPTLGARFGKPPARDERARHTLIALEKGDPRELRGFTGFYARMLNITCRHAGVTVLVIVLVLTGAFTAYGKFGRGMTFFNDGDPTYARVAVRARGNLSPQEIYALVREVEDRVITIPGIKSVNTQTQRAVAGGGGGELPTAADTVGFMFLELHDGTERRLSGAELLERARQATADLAGIVVEVRALEQGPPVGKPIQIQFSAADKDLLDPVVARVRAHVDANVQGLRDVEDSRPLPGVEWRLSVDRAQAALYGADVSLVGIAVQLVTGGVKVGEYRPDTADDAVDIRVRYPASARGLAALDELKVTTANGLVPIGNFVRRSAAPNVDAIERIGGRAVRLLRAEVAPGVLADDKVKEIRAWVESAELDPRVTVAFRGANEEQDDSITFILAAMGMALLLMFVLLVTQFNSLYQSFLILVAVVMSTAGVLLGLLVTGSPFSAILTGVGVVALAGIVVNNNIVLIDTYNHNRRADPDAAPLTLVVRSAAQRLRPVLLTATTTVCGLLPLASHLSVDFIERTIVYGGQLSGFWVPLAQAIVSGLTVATVLTLVATPAMLALPHSPWAKAAGSAALALARAPRLAWQALAARQPKPFTNTIR